MLATFARRPRHYPRTDVDSTDALATVTNASSYSHPTRPFEDEHPRRMMEFELVWDDTTDNLSTVTLAGVAAQIHVQDRLGSVNAAIASALVPTGTTGTVAMTFASTVQTQIFRLSRVHQFRKTASFATGKTTANGTSATLSIRVPPLGYAYGVAAGVGVFTAFDDPVFTTANHGPFENLSGLWGRYVNPTRQLQLVTFKANKSVSSNIALVAASFWGDN